MSTSNAGGGPATVTAPDGTDLAKEVTADRAADATEALAGAVDGSAIRVVDASPPPTFAAAPPTATDAPAVRIVGDGLDRFNEPILRVKAEDGQVVVAVQGDGSGDPQDTPPWLMKTVKDVGGGTMADKTIATEETAEAALSEMADDATTADVNEVRDRLPAALDGGRLAVETELAATGALATEAKQDTGNASLVAIDAGIPAALGQAAAVASMPVVLPTTQAGGPLALEADKATATNQATQITRETEIRDRLDRRTTDPLTTAPAHVVRTTEDACAFDQTTPGASTYYRQVSNVGARLESFKLVNTSPGADLFVMVFDVANYTPGTTPDISKRRHLGVLRASQGGTPGFYAASFSSAEMNANLAGTSTPVFSSGILVLITTAATSAAPATTATIQMEIHTKAALA